MEVPRMNMPMGWEERWRIEKERRKKVMEEGGEKFEEENRKLRWIRAFNDRRMGLKAKEEMENVRRNDRTNEEIDCAQSEKDEAVKYSTATHPGEIFGALQKLRQCSPLTDLTLRVGSGLHFQAHSLVLAAVSSVIQQRLREWDAEKPMEMLLCSGPEISALGLSAVLEFAYSGTMTGLTRESLAEIQTAAVYLGVPRVLELCKAEEEREKKDGEQKMEDKRKTSAEEQMKVSLQSIRQMWEDRLGCDVELEAEGRIFHAHKVVLSASSDYFWAMFSSGMKESQQASVSLLLLGADELNVLLHCCYSGDLLLDWGCVFDITSTALQFQFRAAVSLCLEFLEQRMDVHNCLDVMAFAEAYMMADLSEKAEDFVLVHFHKVAETPEFRDLPAMKLQDLLRRDELCAPSELAVFRAVAAWIEADPAGRLPLARQLMAGVRFPLMTFREFCEVRAVDLHMECAGADGAELYGSALREFGFGGTGGSKARHRMRRPKDVIVVVGGDQLNPDDGRRLPSRQLWFANSLHSGTGLVKEIEWRMLGEMPEQARFRHGVCVLHGAIYIAGGCHYYCKADTMKSVYRYKPLKNSWEKLADMQECRSNFVLVTRGDSLYAIGGDRDLNTNLDSVEKYFPDTNSWSFTHLLDQALSGHAACTWRGEIFISGGFNRMYECLVSTLLYHPQRGTTSLADMTGERAQHCMEALGERFWVAGGVCNLRKFYTDQLACESYDPMGDTWTTFSPLPLSHVGAASAVLEGKLYVLGGYCQEDYSEARLVHRYEPGTQRWENMGKMAGPVTDIRACLTRLPTELRK
ncbi:kelch-like protein 33 [Brachyhypopomus gauderio]|uniref:kelch-like protein 33 n=1 Tax=Brachyhypopomus gauderio TaxID=698409 RepID=UPI0040432555